MNFTVTFITTLHTIGRNIQVTHTVKNFRKFTHMIDVKIMQF